MESCGGNVADGSQRRRHGGEAEEETSRVEGPRTRPEEGCHRSKPKTEVKAKANGREKKGGEQKGEDVMV